MEEVAKKSRREFIIWSVIFSIAGTFQFYRGAPSDGFIFFSVVALIAIDMRKNIGVTNPSVIKSFKALYLVLVIILAFSKIHTDPALISILFITPIIILTKKDTNFVGDVSLSLLRSVGIWAAFAIAVSAYEMLSFIVGDVTDRPYHYPTISMLVDPMLHSSSGRIFFVSCWSWIGYRIIFPRVAK